MGSTMMQTGSVSRSVATSRPVYGYLNRPVLASTRLCNISLSMGALIVLSSRRSGPVAGLAAGISDPGCGAGPGASGDS